MHNLHDLKRIACDKSVKSLTDKYKKRTIFGSVFIFYFVKIQIVESHLFRRWNYAEN